MRSCEKNSSKLRPEMKKAISLPRNFLKEDNSEITSLAALYAKKKKRHTMTPTQKIQNVTTAKRRETYPLKQDIQIEKISMLDRGRCFGNAAMALVLLQQRINHIQSRSMKEIVQIVGASCAHLMYLCDGDLVWCIAGKWFRAKATLGIVGSCVQSEGGVECVSSATEDARYHEFTDSVEGQSTKSLMCFPVHANKGGALMGVVRVLNKRDGEDFGGGDQSLVQAIVTKSAAKYEEIFMDLTELNSSISTFASPILPTDGAPRDTSARTGTACTSPRHRRTQGEGLSANSASALNTMKIMRSRSSCTGESDASPLDVDPDNVLRSQSCGEPTKRKIPARPTMTKAKSLSTINLDELRPRSGAGGQWVDDESDECIVLPALPGEDDELLGDNVATLTSPRSRSRSWGEEKASSRRPLFVKTNSFKSAGEDLAAPSSAWLPSVQDSRQSPSPAPPSPKTASPVSRGSGSRSVASRLFGQTHDDKSPASSPSGRGADKSSVVKSLSQKLGQLSTEAVPQSILRMRERKRQSIATATGTSQCSPSCESPVRRVTLHSTSRAEIESVSM